jgi:rhodanese-related sulfurtransferase
MKTTKARSLGPVLILSLLALCWVVLPASSNAQQQVVKDINPPEAYELVQKNKGNPNFAILDIRTQMEFDQGYVAGAVLIDYYLPNFEDELGKLDKNKAYLVYCRTARRSDDAVLIMKKMGFREVYNMVGGIVGWKAAKLPLVK